SCGITGWVLNDGEGVCIHAEGTESALDAFVASIGANPPLAARVQSVDVRATQLAGFENFRILRSERNDRSTARISPDLPVCDECVAELFDPADRRYEYPYINCTNCGPRYSIVLGMPYDRARTTMNAWPMCTDCASEYNDPADRRFHAQPVACAACGPRYSVTDTDGASVDGDRAIAVVVDALRAGLIVAIKGLGGYHVCCDAERGAVVTALRERKFRKDRPFALMARDLDVARSVVELSAESEALLTSIERPIVIAAARTELNGVSPDNLDLGVMLPYAPLHHLMFERGAPRLLVMTSGNHSSEPIAYRDEDALERLSDIADVFLAGQRRIARRVDDSVTRVGALGPVILRRARGFAPGVVARLESSLPILAVGADLKNSVTLVIDGEAIVSQHIGDLEHHEAYVAFEEAIGDLMSMHEVASDEICTVHDLHPQYASTAYALALPAAQHRGIQHHRAHVASVLAERGELEKRVIGVAFDGTGYGDDGTIWGGEFFAGSVLGGLKRVAHLRTALLPGGDAAARWPVQAAAGFLLGIDGLADLREPPFEFPHRYGDSVKLVQKGMRSFSTTSAGRLFDTVAALLGFTRAVTFEGQAAMWVEQLGRQRPAAQPYPFAFEGGVLDYRPALESVIEDRRRGRALEEIARAFHQGLAQSVAGAITALCEQEAVDTAVLSGGVFQNDLLVADLAACLRSTRITLWTNRIVPPNDGGISLGQAALSLEEPA
nr:carbamoyltransferase HypF [Gemmatimonadaceae bacterium]